MIPQKIPQKKWYVKQRARGYCGNCGQKPALPGRCLCAKCREKSVKRQRAVSPEIKARYAAGRKQKVKEAADKLEAETGYRTSPHHRAMCKKYALDLARRKLCSWCQKPLNGRKWTCSKYRPKQKASQQRRRLRLVAQGICGKCGQRPLVENRKHCRECLDRALSNLEVYRQKKGTIS